MVNSFISFIFAFQLMVWWFTTRTWNVCMCLVRFEMLKIYFLKYFFLSAQMVLSFFIYLLFLMLFVVFEPEFFFLITKCCKSNYRWKIWFWKTDEPTDNIIKKTDFESEQMINVNLLKVFESICLEQVNNCETNE